MKTTLIASAMLLLCGIARSAEPEFTDVFLPAQDGYQSIRIPAIVVTRKGTLLAFAEGRARDADQAKNRLVLKRSEDGGRTWGKIETLRDNGEGALNNPCAVVERQSGQILLMYQSYPAGLSEYNAKLETGFEGEKIVRNFVIRSDDDGRTWSSPADITRESKRPDKVTTIASGPGVGIQLRHGLHAGRLLFPLNERAAGLWNIYAVYSDDRGKTWKHGDIAPGGTVPGTKGGTVSLVNEAQFVELADGSVRFNVRRAGGAALRKTCVSADGGQTWSKVEDVPELKDPTCNASIVRYSDPADGQPSRILYAGPQSTKRENGMVFLSTDEGRTWPVSKVLWKGPFAYCSLIPLPDSSIGCLFEADGAQRIVFARFALEWLMPESPIRKP